MLIANIEFIDDIVRFNSKVSNCPVQKSLSMVGEFNRKLKDKEKVKRD